MGIYQKKMAVITEEGLALHTKLSDKSRLIFTRAETGSNRTPDDEISILKNISNPKQQCSLGVAVQLGEKIRLPMQIRAGSIKDDYELWQIGVYAKTDESDEILYLVVQYSTADTVPANDPHFYIDLTFNISMGTAGTVISLYDPKDIATHAELNSMIEASKLYSAIFTTPEEPDKWEDNDWWFEELTAPSSYENGTLIVCLAAEPYNESKTYHITVGDKLHTLSNAAGHNISSADVMFIAQP